MYKGEGKACMLCAEYTSTDIFMQELQETWVKILLNLNGPLIWLIIYSVNEKYEHLELLIIISVTVILKADQKPPAALSGVDMSFTLVW